MRKPFKTTRKALATAVMAGLLSCGVMATGFAAPVEGISYSGGVLTPDSYGYIAASDILSQGGGAKATDLSSVKAELEGRIKVTEDLLAGDWGGKTVQDAINVTAQAITDLEAAENGKISALDLRVTNAEGAIPVIQQDISDLKNGKLDKAEFTAYKEATASTISTMNTAITDENGAIAALDLRMDAAESAIDSNINVIIPNIYKTITDLETAENGKIAGLDGRVTSAEGAIDNLVKNKANTDMDNLTEAGKTAVKDLAKESINVVGEGPVSVAKSDVSGVDTYTVSVKTDGKVESGDTGIVTGGTVYNETRVAADGNYVKASNSVGDNLSALDTELAALTVGTGAGLDEVSHRIDNVDSKINKVGAGAAALAALHPMDTDGKFSMAAGFGNYRDANAMALGLFYRPTDQVMFSMGGSMGNGENLLNVGVSFALDKGVSTSKAAMARKIAAQDEKITSLEGQNARQAAEIAALKEALARLEAKIGK